MTENFSTIGDLIEVPQGLHIEHRDGTTSFLRRDHQRYARIEAILRCSHEMNVDWPVFLTRSDDGVIIDVQMASRGQVYVVDEEASGDCTAYILLLSSPKILKRDHPEYLRLFETLMFSAGEKRDVFYSEVPDQSNVLADVCFAS